MTTRTTYLATAAILALAAISAPSAQAAYVITFQQVGSDVAETGSGSLDLTDLSVVEFGIASRRVSRSVARPRLLGRFHTTRTHRLLKFLPEVIPNIWPRTYQTTQTSTSGGPVGFVVWRRRPYLLFFSPQVTFPARPYRTLRPISTPRSVRWAWRLANTSAHWGSGDHADTLTIDVVGPPAVPEASTWAMMLIGFAGLGPQARLSPHIP